jgi:anti-sigma factor RsiW
MSSLSEQDQADLVAYLDGELDDDTARALEAKLSLDPGARAEAESLRKTWDLLEYLPQPEPSASFTHRTLEKLAVQRTMRRSVGARHGWPWWAVGLSWAAALLVAAAGGLGAAHLLWPRERTPPGEAAEVEAMVRNPRIIESKRVYDQVEDLDFLRGLDFPDLFGDEETGT